MVNAGRYACIIRDMHFSFLTTSFVSNKGKIRVKHKKRTQEYSKFKGSNVRSGWDSNPRDVAVKLISSQPRYDHFDTAPWQRWNYITRRQALARKLEKAPADAGA